MRRGEPRIFHSWGSRGRPRRSLKNHPRQSPTICLSYTSFPVFSNPTATVEVVGNTGKLSLKRLRRRFNSVPGHHLIYSVFNQLRTIERRSFVASSENFQSSNGLL